MYISSYLAKLHFFWLMSHFIFIFFIQMVSPNLGMPQYCTHVDELMILLVKPIVLYGKQQEIYMGTLIY